LAWLCTKPVMCNGCGKPGHLQAACKEGGTGRENHTGRGKGKAKVEENELRKINRELQQTGREQREAAGKVLHCELQVEKLQREWAAAEVGLRNEFLAKEAKLKAQHKKMQDDNKESKKKWQAKIQEQEAVQQELEERQQQLRDEQGLDDEEEETDQEGSEGEEDDEGAADAEGFEAWLGEHVAATSQGKIKLMQAALASMLKKQEEEEDQRPMFGGRRDMRQRKQRQKPAQGSSPFVVEEIQKRKGNMGRQWDQSGDTKMEGPFAQERAADSPFDKGKGRIVAVEGPGTPFGGAWTVKGAKGKPRAPPREQESEEKSGARGRSKSRSRDRADQATRFSIADTEGARWGDIMGSED
jgi:hypothetical protein